jgi:hypothetical protein
MKTSNKNEFGFSVQLKILQVYRRFKKTFQSCKYSFKWIASSTFTTWPSLFGENIKTLLRYWICSFDMKYLL